MKYLLISLIFLASEKSCDSQNQLPFVKATSQNWSGGAAGSGHGTYYNIYLAMDISPDFTFDSLWVNNKRLAVSLKPNQLPNDTLVLSSNDMSGMIRNPNDLNKSQEEIQAIPFPVEGKAAGVLGYLYKGERKYLIIESWIKLKPIYYP
jgi:hypothetical protein